MENQKRKSTWSTILKVIIAVATAKIGRAHV